MISEQYGTVFTGEHYEKFQKVYSIWICPDPAKKRRNGIFRYHTVQDPVWGKAWETPDNYDLMEFRYKKPHTPVQSGSVLCF